MWRSTLDTNGIANYTRYIDNDDGVNEMDHMQRQKEMGEDWVQLIATIRQFAVKYNLEMPTLVLDHDWMRNLKVAAVPGIGLYESGEWVHDGVQYMGVTIRFGRFENHATILRT